MAKAGRLDGVSIDAKTGFITIRFTAGEAPLPAAWQGEAMNFESAEAFADVMRGVEERFTGQDLAMVQAAAALKADPTMRTTFESKCLGKECRLDLTADDNPIVVGR